VSVEEIILDVRDMEPPEPYEAATAALLVLEPGQYLRMISRRRPRMLYPWLAEREFSELTREYSEEHYEIFICRSGDGETAKLVSGLGTITDADR